MSLLSSGTVRAYLIPGAVFQSVVVAGGYGTGRELVEYFTRYGGLGGLLAMGVTVICWAAVLAVTFEFARVFQVYDYRRFFQRLIGRGWIAFEILYVLMFLLVLAVVASAAGEILRERFDLPYGAGLMVMLTAVATLNFFGREIVTRSLAISGRSSCTASSSRTSSSRSAASAPGSWPRCRPAKPSRAGG